MTKISRNLSGIWKATIVFDEEHYWHTGTFFGLWKAYYLLFPKQALVFMCLQYKSFENTVGKGEIARKEQFLLFPQCFLPIWRNFCHLHENKKCCLQTPLFWKSLKFVVWKRVKLSNIQGLKSGVIG